MLGLALVGLFGYRVLAAKQQRAEAERAPEAVAVSVAVGSVQRKDVVERVTMTGTVRPKSEVQVATKVSGRLEQVLGAVGQRVEAGALLAVVEHRELTLQTEQGRAQTQAAVAAHEQAESQLDNARVQLERAKALHAEGSLSKAELDRAESGSKAAQAAVRAAQAQIAMTQASAGLAAEALHNSRVTTPIAGTIVRRSAEVGAQASPGTTLFVVQDVSQLKLEASVPAEDFVRLQLGQAVTITVEELPGQRFAGTLATLSPSLDPQTRRAAVEVAIDNAEGKLLSNMLAHAEVVVGERKAALTLPEDAVLSLPEGRVVFVVRDGLARRVSPVLAPADDRTLLALEGLSEGERVVIGGQAGLSDGTPVTISGEGVTGPTGAAR